MIALTYAFRPVEDLFESMIAPLDGDLYKSVVQHVYSAPKAFERSENWKEIYQN